MHYISSTSHPLIKEIVTLHSAKGRALHHKSIGEGLRVCTTIARSPLTIEHLFVTSEHTEQAHELVSSDKIIEVSGHVFAKLSAATTPSGMLIVFHIPSHELPPAVTTGLVLAQIADPGNMGTLLRTSAALGYTAVVVVEGVDPWNPKVIQATAGTIGDMMIVQYSWEQLVSQCAVRNIRLSALVVRDGDNFFTAVPYERELCVVGSEALGLPEAWVAMCDRRLTLPMPGGTESLNAAIAGSLALYGTYLRQQKIYS